MQENESNTWFHSYTQAIVVHSLYNRTPTSRKNELPSHAVLLTVSLQTTGGPRDARYHTNGFLFSRIRDNHHHRLGLLRKKQHSINEHI